MLSGAAVRPTLSAIRFSSIRFSFWDIWIATGPGLSGRLGGGRGFQRANRVARYLAQTFAVVGGKVHDNFAAHPGIPDATQMLSGRSHRLGMVGLRALKESRDLIGHRDQVMD